jgi:hypothetical protein
LIIKMREVAPEYRTPKGAFRGRWPADALASQVGEMVPFSAEAWSGLARLVAVSVAEDGSWLDMSLDVPDGITAGDVTG